MRAGSGGQERVDILREVAEKLDVVLKRLRSRSSDAVAEFAVQEARRLVGSLYQSQPQTFGSGWVARRRDAARRWRVLER